MLDQIIYEQVNGEIKKTVTSISVVTDIESEKSALRAQITAFSTPADDPALQAELDAAILNYTEQLTLLEELS